MDTIASFFLRAKHWQIFGLLFGLYIFGAVVVVALPAAPLSPGSLGAGRLAFGAVVALLMVSLLAWFWSMGSFLSSIVQPGLRLKGGFFRFALIYPFLYIFAFIPFFLSPRPVLFAVIFPLHLFAMFCMFYSLYFVSKNLALAEAGKPVSFYDYAGAFFLVWFFPIGVWVIQPRINRLYATRKTVQPSPA
jgi:hypothetical protein